MGPLRAQLRQVLRRLSRAPLFTAIMLITLAIGTGANTAIFTVLESVVLRPLPYPQPERLVGVWHAAPAMNLPELNMSPANYFIYREESRAFTDVGMFHNDSVNVTGLGEPEHLSVLAVTDGVLPLLGTQPALGRLFNREDDKPGSPKTVIVSYAYWQRKLGGEPAAIGRTLTVDGSVRQIIGVLPRAFNFLDSEPSQLVLPLQLDRAAVHLGEFSYEGLARLAPGVTMAQANADVQRLIPIVIHTFPAPPGFSLDLFEKAHITANVRPLMRDVVGDVGTLLWILMASISLVLLIACANVANLLLVRAEGRQQELAIRAALGASRARIAAELMFESLVIGLLGGALGLAFAWGALELLQTMAPAGLPRLREIGIDAPVLLFTLGVSLLASLLFGCVPIIKYSGTRGAVGFGERTASASRERHRARNTLVVVQVGLAFVLLVCSGLMVRTFHALTQVSPGYVAAGVQTFRIGITEADVPEPDQVLATQEEILRRLAAVPGVSAVGLTNGVPMEGNQWNDPVFVQDRSYAADELPALRRFGFISPEYLGTMGIPLVAGRPFSWSEVHARTPVAVVSEAFAREVWHDPGAAVGKRIRVGTNDDWREIVGVAGDVHDDGLNRPAPTKIYWPLLLAGFEGSPVQIRRDLAVVVRSPRAGSESLMKELRAAVWAVDANLPLANVRTVAEYATKSMARTAFTLVMLALAGGMALLLGVVGLYGVIAYSVSKRTREIGIRMALGARERDMTRMFVRQGLWLTLAGVACGVVVSVATMRLLSSLLFQVSAVDPLTYIVVAAGLIATAALATFLPSRRAASVDPASALRSE